MGRKTHMQKHIARTIVGLGILLWPFTAIAAPSAVTGIRGTYRGGIVELQWNPSPASERISYYRVYFSHTSILENNGSYDDFDTTVGNLPRHTLTAFPPVETLFIGILAVDENEDESPFFHEETRVTLREGVSSSMESVESSSSSLSLRETSSSSSKELSPPSSFSSPSSFFTSSLGIPPVTPMSPQDVGDVRIRATATSPDTYIVVVQWQSSPIQEGVAGFVLRQSRDRGGTYGAPQTLAPAVTGAEIRNVTPGKFSVLVQVIGMNGTLSRGVLASITLPKGISRKPPEKPLSRTGAGTVAVLSITGGIMGWRKAKKLRIDLSLSRLHQAEN